MNGERLELWKAEEGQQIRVRVVIEVSINGDEYRHDCIIDPGDEVNAIYLERIEP